MRPARTALTKAQEQTPLPPLRRQIVSFDRQVVDTTEPVWRIRTSSDGGELIRIDWARWDRDLGGWTAADREREIVRHYLATLIVRCKARSVGNAFFAVRHFIRWYLAHHAGRATRDRVFAWRQVTLEDLLSFLAEQERTSASRGNNFTLVRAMYAWGAFGAQLPDFDPSVAVALSAERARGNVKGAAVRFHDERKGPLDADEQRLILDAIRGSAGTAEQRALVMLHTELGLNPHATVRIRNSGLKRYEAGVVGPDGQLRSEVEYHLEVPRMKKRTEYRETRVRPITEELGNLLRELTRGGPDDPLIAGLPADQPEKQVGAEIRVWAIEAGLVSPRTRNTLHLTPRRLRYTLATQMAREGASREKIADVLDHTDLQTVEVYIEASSYVSDQVGRRLDPVLAPRLRRFAGRVVERDGAGVFDGVPRRVVPGVAVQLPVLPLDVGGIGLCGRDVQTHGLCKLAPPLSCYLCDKFAAFRDAPHGEIAEALERVVADKLGRTSDERISLQLTDTLQAILQLQAQIAEDAVHGGGA